MINKIRTCFNHGVLVLFLLSFPCVVNAADRPNILFIFIDDMGPMALSCYGNEDVETPAIDSLASAGLRFTQAYACSQCSPTRAAFFTGQYGPRNGMTKVVNSRFWPKAPMLTPTTSKAISPDVSNIVKVLRKAGYTTGMSGKWHIGGPYDSRGMSAREGYAKSYGFDFCGTMGAKPRSPLAVEEITDDAITFIHENKTKPWFFYASHKTTHTPLVAPVELVEKHVSRGYEKTNSRWGDLDQRPTADYLAMLEHLDNNVGRLLSTLDELGLADNTLVLLMGDNGTLDRVASSSPLRGGKGMAYEAGIRVPLLMRWPKLIEPGTTNGSLTHIIDLYPTFVSLAQASPPADHHLDGITLVPAMKGGSLDRNTLYWHMPHYVPMYARTPCSVIRQGDWKLIHYYGDTFDTTGFTPVNRKPAGRLVLGAQTELYNLAKDPGETTDLAATNPDKRDELFTDLQAWLHATSAKLPIPNPDRSADPSKWLTEAASRQR